MAVVILKLLVVTDAVHQNATRESPGAFDATHRVEHTETAFVSSSAADQHTSCTGRGGGVRSSNKDIAHTCLGHFAPPHREKSTRLSR